MQRFCTACTLAPVVAGVVEGNTSATRIKTEATLQRTSGGGGYGSWSSIRAKT